MSYKRGQPAMPKKEKIVSLDFAVRFFLEKIRNKQTRKTYNYALAEFQRVVGEGRTLQSMTPVDVQKYINAQVSRGNKPYTIYKRHKELRAFFNWCMRMKYLDDNPALAVKLKKPDVPVDERMVISIEEILKLKHYLEVTRDTKLLAMVSFLADTGCRRGGLANLKIADLNLENRTAMVFEKGDILREVDYSEGTAKALLAWLETRPICDHNYVFTGSGKPYAPMQAPSIAQAIRRRCASAGIGSFGTHTFRHRKGFEMFKTGAAPILVAKVLGHADGGQIAMKHYSDYQREAIKALSRATFPDAETVIPKSADSGKIIELRRRK